MAAETDPDALLEKLQTLNESLDELEEKLESLFETDLAEHLSDVSPLEAAKLNATVAYALATVIYAYLKTHGVNPKEHPVKAELDRIKAYFIKIATAEGSYKPAMKIDKAAAKRFISAALKEGGNDT